MKSFTTGAFAGPSIANCVRAPAAHTAACGARSSIRQRMASIATMHGRRAQRPPEHATPQRVIRNDEVASRELVLGRTRIHVASRLKIIELCLRAGRVCPNRRAPACLRNALARTCTAAVNEARMLDLGVTRALPLLHREWAMGAGGGAGLTWGVCV